MTERLYALLRNTISVAVVATVMLSFEPKLEEVAPDLFEPVRYALIAIFTAAVTEALWVFVFTRPSLTIEWRKFGEASNQTEIDLHFVRQRMESGSYSASVRVDTFGFFARLLLDSLTSPKREKLYLEVQLSSAPVRAVVDNASWDEPEARRVVPRDDGGFAFWLSDAPDQSDAVWRDAELTFASAGTRSDLKYEIRYRLMRNTKRARFAEMVLARKFDVKKVRVRGE